MLNSLTDKLKQRIKDSYTSNFEKFLELSLTAFNTHPPFSNVSFNDTEIIKEIEDVLIDYALYLVFAIKSTNEIGVFSDIYGKKSQEYYKKWKAEIKKN